MWDRKKSIGRLGNVLWKNRGDRVQRMQPSAGWRRPCTSCDTLTLSINGPCSSQATAGVTGFDVACPATASPPSCAATRCRTAARTTTRTKLIVSNGRRRVSQGRIRTVRCDKRRCVYVLTAAAGRVGTGLVFPNPRSAPHGTIAGNKWSK